MVETIKALARPGAPTQVRLRVTLALVTLVGLTLVVQAGTRMLWPGLYRDLGFALDAWRVSNPVMLLAAVPVLCVSLALARCASAWRWTFTSCWTRGAFVASGASLIAGLTVLDPAALGRSLSAATPARLVSGYRGVWAVLLGLAWAG